MVLSSFSRFVVIEELVMLVLVFANFSTTRSIAQTDNRLRRVVQLHLRLRYRALIVQYVGERFKEFTNIIGSCKGVIAGSSALHFMSQPCRWRPPNLNLVVPRGNSPSLIALLTSLDYVIVPSKVAHSHILSVHHHWKLAREQDQKLITVSERLTTRYTLPCSIHSRQPG